MPEASKKSKKQSYIGSVRFFKHVIILIFVLAVTVPAVTAVVMGLQNMSLRESLETLSTQSPAAGDDAINQEDQVNLPDLPMEVPAWQSLYPDLYAQAPEVRSTVDEEKTVYLTFDDGPSAQTTKILDILEAYDVKATFFVVGHSDEQDKARMKAIVDAGHSIGVHTYSHDYKKIYASVEAYLEDFSQEYALIYEATGVYPQIFRFPGGSINGYNGITYKDIISEMVRRGFVYFDWNVATGDAVAGTDQTPSTLAANALQNVNSLRRSVVLMHDSADKGSTVTALSSIIEGYQDAGFTFEALTAEVVPVVYSYPDDSPIA